MLVHGFTYNAHPVSVAAGKAVLDRIRSGELVEAADAEKGAIGKPFAKALRRLSDLPHVGDVRGMGLLWGIEFVEDRATKTPFAAEKKFSSRVAAMAWKRGVLTYPMQGCIEGNQGDHILLAPPAAELERLVEGVNLLADAILEAGRQAARS
jgi:adenosylmethionine-8-amino-7-oxononanoate aminotransferase